MLPSAGPRYRRGNRRRFGRKLRSVQNELFVIGSHLACPDDRPPAHLPSLEESSIGRLEMEMDAATEELEPLRNFIFPGGSETSARLHVARAVCRRAERVVVTFSHDRPVSATVITYLNRLSDWLFVQARWANFRSGWRILSGRNENQIRNGLLFAWLRVCASSFGTTCRNSTTIFITCSRLVMRIDRAMLRGVLGFIVTRAAAAVDDGVAIKLPEQRVTAI